MDFHGKSGGGCSVHPAQPWNLPANQLLRVCLGVDLLYLTSLEIIFQVTLLS